VAVNFIRDALVLLMMLPVSVAANQDISHVCVSRTQDIKYKSAPSKAVVSVSSIEKPCLASAPSSLKPAVVDGLLDNLPVHILVDSGPSENFVDFKIYQKFHLAINGSPASIGMASSEVSIPTCRIVVATFSFHNRTYPTTTFSVIKNLCSDVIVGQEFLKLHSSVTFVMNGPEEVLAIWPLKPQQLSVAVASTHLAYLSSSFLNVLR